MSRFSDLFSGHKPLIGMIHLPPLPGYAGAPGIEQAVLQAVQDVRILEDSGVAGVLVENEYDRPHSVSAAPETIAAMTRITRAVVEEARNVIVGCEILLNDPKASLAVAAMSGAQFIRTDYFVDAMTRPGYGEFEIDAAGLIEYRRSLGAGDILVFADIQVKYATMITPRPLSESARIASAQGADALVVSGNETGDAPTVEHLRDASHGSPVPVLVGSGLSASNASELLAACDGAIVGTSLMRNRRPDAEAVRALKASADRSNR